MATINLDRFRDVDLVIDKANDNFIAKQWTSTGDKSGRTLTVMITNGGIVGELTGATASLLWTNKANGLTDETAFVLKDKATSKFVIEYPTHMLTPGTVVAQIRIWYDGKVVTTKPFEITVSGIGGQMAGVVKQQEFGLLTAVLADANKFRYDIDLKADKTYVDAVLSSISAGGPRELFYSLQALKTKYPNGAEGTYLVFDASHTDGAHSYMWKDGAWSDLGVYQGLQIPDGSVTAPKLTNLYNYRRYVASGLLSDIRESGLYTVSGDNPNVIDPPARAIGVMLVMATRDYIMQMYIPTSNTKNIFTRNITPATGLVTTWEWLTEIKSASINRSKLVSDYDSKGAYENAILNDYKDSGTYLIINAATDAPEGFKKSCLLTVQKNGQWIHQTLTDLQIPSRKIYRYFFNTWRAWESNSILPLLGKSIVNFGDSLIGNTQDSTSVSNVISDKTGATVYNVGFGGCRMGQHDEYWDAFSMYRLADEIVKENADPTKWQLQTDAVNATSWTSRPHYFPTSLNRLKSIDFNTVDFIIISYSTNDYMGGNLLDNSDNIFDTTTFGGALRYSLRAIQTKYPHIKILVTTGTYCFWYNPGGSVSIDSDAREFAGGKMIDFVNKAIDICQDEFNVNVLDNYRKLGINQYNRSYFFSATDGIHHQADGRKLMGDKIGNALIYL